MFEESDGYDTVYAWFAYLKKSGWYVLVYVIIPNHLQALLYPYNPNASLNKLVVNGKRFMAYDFVSRLTYIAKTNLLHQIGEGVQNGEAKKSKKNQVFRLYFDAQKCFKTKMLKQKLDNIHYNPVQGKYKLIDDPT